MGIFCELCDATNVTGEQRYLVSGSNDAVAYCKSCNDGTVETAIGLVAAILLVIIVVAVLARRASRLFPAETETVKAKWAHHTLGTKLKIVSAAEL